MPRFLRALVLVFSLTPVLAAQQTDLSLASNGLDFLAVFAKGNRPSLEAAAFAPLPFGGKTFGPEQNLVIFSTPQFAVSRQSVAFAGNVYLIATEERLAIALRRVTSNGVLIDQTPMVIDTAAVGPPAVATDGTSFLVVWPTSGRLQAAIVAPDGTVGPVRTLVARDGWILSNPRVAFDGTRFVVTFGTFLIPPFPATTDEVRVEAVVVTRDAVAGQPIALFDTIQPGAPIASSGRDFLVVANVQNDIVAWSLVAEETSLRVDRKSTLLHGLDAAASVAWNGAAYVVAWHALGPFNFGVEFPQSFLGLTHVHTDGTADPISSIATGGHDAIDPFAPAAAVNGLGAEMILVEQLDGTTPRATAYRSEEVSGHRVDPPPAPVITSTRFGVDGLTVTWTRQSSTERGFIVQSTAVPAGTAAYIVRGARAPMTITVRAWNEAGLSAPAMIYVRPPYRVPGRR